MRKGLKRDQALAAPAKATY